MDPNEPNNLKTLGAKVTKFQGLDTFPRPEHCKVVACVTDEVTAVCPVTGQPDWYKVEITYVPREVCVESKALKLYVQSFRDQGHFCEKFADIIAVDLNRALKPETIMVTVTQKARGGISIVSSSEINNE